MTASFKIHTSIESARAVLPVGMVQVDAKWNATTKQTKMERSIHVGFQCLKAPEVTEAFRAVVESVLASAASETLKSFVGENPNSFEIPESLFTREALCESFLSRADNWMSKEALELGFTKSATWARIVSRPEFEGNYTYKAQANKFKDAILKLSGKAVQMTPDQCDKILVTLSEDDLETEFGAFVCKRLAALKAKAAENEFDLSAL